MMIQEQKVESIHSVGYGSSVWKKLKENDLSPELECGGEELEGQLEGLAVDTYTRSNDRRASLLPGTIHEGDSTY